MCGIVGFAGAPIERASLALATRILEHRGPDAEGLWVDGVGERAVGLGHRRLSILDLSAAANQPMASACGRFVIAYNGEVFNFAALGSELRQHGCQPRTSSDTEVVLELLARKGVEGLASLSGMFALAVHDTRTGRLVLARDHLGIKPLYWAMHGGALCFASEIKALFALGVQPRLRHDVVGEFLLRGWVQHPDTAFEGVYSLEPGTWLAWEDGKRTSGTFWDTLPPTPDAVRSTDEQLEALLAETIRGQLVSDRPLGVYVSGGVDSSLIYALAGSADAHRLALSARFRDADIAPEGVEDDGRWADRLLSRHPPDRRAQLVLTPDHCSCYEALTWYLDEPVADPAIVPTYLLARRARELGAVVMLSGMGADEVFGGYRRYSLWPIWSALGASGRGAVATLGAAAAVGQRLPSPATRRRATYLSRLAGALDEGWPISYAAMVGQITPSEVDALAGREWRDGLGAKLARTLAGWEHASWLNQAQRLDLKGFLASHNLLYADKASMAASVEVRVPFLDPRVVEAALALPEHQRATLRAQKPWLKGSCARLVGPDIAYRAKAGFTLPVRAWLQSHLREGLEARLRGERLASVLRAEAVHATLDDHFAGRADNTWKLWTLLTLDLWLERFAPCVAT